MPVCISRHITLRFFLMVRDMALSSGPKSSIDPVKSLASAPYRVEKTSPGLVASGQSPRLPLDNCAHSLSGVLPSGEIRPIPVMTTRRDMQQCVSDNQGNPGEP